MWVAKNSMLSSPVDCRWKSRLFSLFLLFVVAFLLFLLAELKQGIDCEQLRQGTPNRLDRNNFV